MGLLRYWKIYCIILLSLKGVVTPKIYHLWTRAYRKTFREVVDPEKSVKEQHSKARTPPPPPPSKLSRISPRYDFALFLTRLVRLYELTLTCSYVYGTFFKCQCQIISHYRRIMFPLLLTNTGSDQRGR